MSNITHAFVGTCVDILEMSELFDDATEMSNCIENAEEDTIEHFFLDVNKHPDDPGNIISFNYDYKLYISYDAEKDIHYFYS